MNFQMIYSSGSVIAERKVFINDQDRPDLYSVVKGRKFFIPFFDDAYEDAEFTSKSGIVKNIGVKESVINEINSYVNHILEDNVTVKSRWINRGHILNLLKEIK
jgi:methionine salvage enolase-phosphatase E1